MKTPRPQVPDAARVAPGEGTPPPASPTLIVGHSRVLGMIASGAPLRTTLHALLELIEHEQPDMLTSIQLVDVSGTRLLHTAAPSLAEDYVRAVDDVVIGPNCGSCGTAAWRRETVEVTDILADPLWDVFRERASSHGLRACWSSPIFSATERVLGTFAVYYRMPRGPDARHRELLAFANRTAAIAIERAQTLEQLRHDKSLLETAQERAHLGIWEINLGTQETTWSRELYRLLGREPALGPADFEEFLEYLHPDDRDGVVEVFERIAHEVRPVKVDFRSNPRLGPVRCFAATIHLAAAVDDGSPIAIGTVMDVTESRRSEQALCESEERLRLALRAANQGIFDWDLRRGMAEVSPEYIHLLEEDPTSFHETTARWLAGIHPDDVDRVAALYDSCMRGKSADFSAEFRLRTGGDTWKWVHATGQVVRRDELGRPQRLLGILADVTEQKTIELALRRSEERYRKLFEEARDAVIAIDPTGRIESLNAAFETLTGTTRGPWIGRPFVDIIHEPDRPDAEGKLAGALQGHVPDPFDLHLVSASGTRVPVELTLSARIEGGQMCGVLAIGRDVTERRHLENQLRHSQRLDSVGQLAGGVAHDFNNILTIIHGSASMMRGSPHFHSSLEAALADIERAAERAGHLTRQLLAFSRRQAMQPADLDLNSVVSNLARLLARVLGEDVALRLDLDPRPPVIHADAGMIEQVLVNLAVNARDAMPVGGTLAITTRHALIDTDQSSLHPGATAGTAVCLSVSDTGAGIPPEVLPRIFEPFFTTKPEGKGTGLGLATVFGIMRQHRGWVEVESTPREGTTFHVYFPRVDHAPPASIQRAEPAPAGRGSETILLAEDEAYVRSMVRMALERHGYRVIAAENGPAALTLWHANPGAVDLLLTDIVMPEGMTGYDLADILREQRPDLPIVFSSGYDPEMLAGRRRPDALTAFLRKPYDIGRLLHTLRSCLDRV